MNMSASHLGQPMIDLARNADFAAAYPDRPCLVVHDVQHHPLFQRAALADLADRLPASHIEHALGKAPVNQDPAHIRAAALSPGDVVRSIDDNGCWMVMKKVEHDPAYAALLDECLAALAPIIGARTGTHRRAEAFIFVSAPNSVTPFHMDPEHNILLQIAGTKTMHVYPQSDIAIVPQATHEAFHRGAHRNLPHRPEFDARAKAYALSPGTAVHVPVKAPHWVQNGPTPSISFSITWRSDASDAEARLHRVNHRLRKLGLTPAAVGVSPAMDAAKVKLHRNVKNATGAARRLLGKERERAAY